jgi:hypothetical protein
VVLLGSQPEVLTVAERESYAGTLASYVGTMAADTSAGMEVRPDFVKVETIPTSFLRRCCYYWWFVR